jgi:hypothetical protein
VSYEAALNLVMAEQREYAADNYGWPMPNDMNAPAGIVDAYSSLARTAADVGHDSAEIARRINAVYDRNMINLAAQFVVLRRAHQLGANLSPGLTEQNLGIAYQRVAADMPATWSIYSGGGDMTADAAREMFFAKFEDKSGARAYTTEKTEWRYRKINGAWREVA